MVRKTQTLTKVKLQKKKKLQLRRTRKVRKHKGGTSFWKKFIKSKPLSSDPVYASVKKPGLSTVVDNFVSKTKAPNPPSTKSLNTLVRNKFITSNPDQNFKQFQYAKKLTKESKNKLVNQSKKYSSNLNRTINKMKATGAIRKESIYANFGVRNSTPVPPLYRGPSLRLPIKPQLQTTQLPTRQLPSVPFANRSYQTNFNQIRLHREAPLVLRRNNMKSTGMFRRNSTTL